MVPSLNSDTLMHVMGYYGSDGPDTSPPTLNDCSTLAYQFVMESFFALIFFIGSIHAGFKHYRTTLTGNAVVAATLDLEYPFLHFKGTDFAIVEAQEMALRCGYIAPSKPLAPGSRWSAVMLKVTMILSLSLAAR